MFPHRQRDMPGAICLPLAIMTRAALDNSARNSVNDLIAAFFRIAEHGDLKAVLKGLSDAGGVVSGHVDLRCWQNQHTQHFRITQVFRIHEMLQLHPVDAPEIFFHSRPVAAVSPQSLLLWEALGAVAVEHVQRGAGRLPGHAETADQLFIRDVERFARLVFGRVGHLKLAVVQMLAQKVLWPMPLAQHQSREKDRLLYRPATIQADQEPKAQRLAVCGLRTFSRIASPTCS